MTINYDHMFDLQNVISYHGTKENPLFEHLDFASSIHDSSVTQLSCKYFDFQVFDEYNLGTYIQPLVLHVINTGIFTW